MNLQRELNKKYRKKMPYQALAEKYNTTYNYVMSIANGTRKAVRGKALEIKKDLAAMIKRAQTVETKAVFNNYYTNEVRLAETEQEERELLNETIIEN